MANFTSIIAIFFSLFSVLQVWLFEDNDKSRKIFFSLTPMVIPILEVTINLTYLYKDSRDLGREFKRIFFSYVLFDYFENYEEKTIMSGNQIYCNQAFNKSCRVNKNLFPAYSVHNSDSLDPIISSKGNIKNDAIKPVCNYVPKANFCFTMEVKSDKAQKLKETDYPKRAELDDFMNTTYYYNFETIKLPGVLKMKNEIGGLKLEKITKEGVYKLVSKEGKLNLYENGVKISKMDYSNFLSWLEMLKNNVLNINGVEYKFKFKKEDKMPIDFEVGRLLFTFDFKNIMVSLNGGSGTYNYKVGNEFIKQLQIIHDLSCWVEYPETGITKSIKYCNRRERNINHCYTFQEIISMCNNRTMEGSLSRIVLYRYKTKYIYNVKKDNGFIIVEGSDTDLKDEGKLNMLIGSYTGSSKGNSEIMENNCGVSKNEAKEEEEEGAYIALLYSILNSIYGKSSWYFQKYINDKCELLKLSDLDKERIIYSLIINYFEERFIKTNNWQRKRIKSDLSYLKLALGLDYLKRTDTSIGPSRCVLPILKIIKQDIENGFIKKLNEANLLANIKGSEIPIKVSKKLENIFSSTHLINRSMGYIKKLTAYGKVKPKSEKGELRLEAKIRNTVRESRSFLKNDKNFIKKVEYNHLREKWLDEHKECKLKMESKGREVLEKIIVKQPESIDEKTKNKNNFESFSYNPNFYRKSYREVLLDRLKIKSEVTKMESVKKIIKQGKSILRGKISENKDSNKPINFEMEYSRLKVKDFQEGKAKNIKKNIKNKTKNYFVASATNNELSNRFSVLEKGEKEIDKLLDGIKNSEKSKNAFKKSFSCAVAFSFEKNGLNSLISKRQRKQAKEMVSFSKNKVCKEKLNSFNDFVNCSGIKLIESVDYTEIETVVNDFVNKAVVADIRTYKKIPNKNLNHWALNKAIDKDIEQSGYGELFNKPKRNNNKEDVCTDKNKNENLNKLKRKSDSSIGTENLKVFKLKTYNFTLTKFEPYTKNNAEKMKEGEEEEKRGKRGEGKEKGKQEEKEKEKEKEKEEKNNDRRKG